MKPDVSLLRFLATGLLNTAFGYGAYALLVILGAPVWLAVAGATALGVMFNFFSYGKLVFGPAGLGRLPAFLAVYGVLYGLNVGLVHVLMAQGVGALLAQALMVPLLAFLSFFLLRHYVYNDPGHHGSSQPDSRTNPDDAGRDRA